MNIFTIFLILTLVCLGSINIFLGNQTLAEECVEYDEGTKTINIICGSYNLSQLKQELDSDILSSNGTQWLLSANLNIGDFSKFFINSTDTDWLQIKGDSKEEYYGIINQGTLIIDNVKISSWNPITKNYIQQIENGTIKRPFIVSDISQGPLNITNSEISHLGYKGSHHQGLSYYVTKDSKIDNTKIHNMWYGFFTNSSRSIDLTNNHFYDNFIYGIDPHTGTFDMLIKNNTVHDTKAGIGIICSHDCYDIIIEDNIVYNNKKAGIMLSRNITDSIVKNNIIYNEKEAISVSESFENEVYGNIIRNSTIGIHIKLLRPLVYDSNFENNIYNNTISDTHTAIKIDPDVNNNAIYGNTLTDSRYGIWISNFTNTDNMIYDNVLTKNNYAIRTIILNDTSSKEFVDLGSIWCKNEIISSGIKKTQFFANTIEISPSENPITLTKTIPAWVKNNVCWMSEGLISDMEFKSSIEYLTHQGIIREKVK